MTAIEEVESSPAIEKCDECGKPMRLQGVGSYFEEGKGPRGTRYYFCYKLCKEWKTVATN